MSITYFFLLLAFIAGAVLPLQASTNNKMADIVDSPVLAALISFLVGTVALVGYIVATGTPLSNLANTRNSTPIAWIGGIFGAFFVASTAVVVPRIGVAVTFALVVAGQMIVTIFVDHFGMLGVEVKEANLPRIIGILLIIGGVVLIRKF